MRRSDPDWGISMSTTGELQRASSLRRYDTTRDFPSHNFATHLTLSSFSPADSIQRPRNDRCPDAHGYPRK